jgi:hypothetical protein
MVSHSRDVGDKIVLLVLRSGRLHYKKTHDRYHEA